MSDMRKRSFVCLSSLLLMTLDDGCSVSCLLLVSACLSISGSSRTWSAQAGHYFVAGIAVLKGLSVIRIMSANNGYDAVLADLG